MDIELNLETCGESLICIQIRRIVMKFEFLTVRVVPGQAGEYFVTQVNNRNVEEYEREFQAQATPVGKKRPQIYALASDPPPQRPLHAYLNVLGERGWNLCEILNNHLFIMQKSI
jgi:hypothetical protein